MATLLYFAVSPNVALSGLGLAFGPDTTPPIPTGDWRQATVDVVIPTLNEAQHLPICLASLMRQTFRPRRVIVVDDSSTDRTFAVAEAFGRTHGMALETVRRRAAIGKTPAVKQVARESDADILFVLDGDTLLDSPTYLARTVEEIYKSAGIACVCGVVLPLGRKHRRVWLDAPEVTAFATAHPEYKLTLEHGWHAVSRGLTNMYRDVLYTFLERFVYRGDIEMLGTMTNPVGCAVAYRRPYLREMFDEFESRFGDDLTNSEDIFIGMAMLDKGYRNVQVRDVQARTVEPELQQLPKQVYLWSSAFLQSAYYFDPLFKSPFRKFWNWITRGPKGTAASGPEEGGRRTQVGPIPHAAMLATPSPLAPMTLMPPVMLLKREEAPAPRAPAAGAPAKAEPPVVREPYAQPVGRDYTRTHGRRAGWMLLMAAVEKVFFPTVLLILALLGHWYGLGLTILLETLLGTVILFAVMKGRRLEYAAKAVAVTPIRYGLIASELVTMARFASDIWIRRDRRWRK